MLLSFTHQDEFINIFLSTKAACACLSVLPNMSFYEANILAIIAFSVSIKGKGMRRTAMSTNIYVSVTIFRTTLRRKSSIHF